MQSLRLWFAFILGSLLFLMSTGLCAADLDATGPRGTSELAAAAAAHSFQDAHLGTEATVAWTVAGGTSGALMGYTVAAAGDVNGDGYGDVIVGAPAMPVGTSRWGRVFLYLGSAAGLSTTAAWTSSAGFGSGYGHAVAGAGDVNDDGYDDILIGQTGRLICETSGECASGFAVLVYGSPSGPSESWGAGGESVIQQGDLEQFGASVAGAGDLNADGYDDIVIGAPGWDNTGAVDAGRFVVYFGSAAGPTSPAVRAFADAGAHCGWSVAGAGDVNGDGFADVIVGAPDHHFHSPQLGKYVNGYAMVYRGSASGIGASSAWSSFGSLTTFPQQERYGYSVAGAGDVNADGFDDVIIGDPDYDDATAGTDVGKAVVHFGSAGSLGSARSIVGSDPSGHLGWSVAGAGDYAEDGYGDVIVGAPDYLDHGQAYVYRGSSTGDLTQFDAWYSDSPSFGWAVACAGDFDGNWTSDLLVGAPNAAVAAITDEGRAFGYRGAMGARPNLILYSPDPFFQPLVVPPLGTVAVDQLSVYNGGTSTAPGYRVGYYLSTDPEISRFDLLLGQVTQPPLGSYQTVVLGAQAFALPPGVTPGIYYVGAIVDDLDAIHELSEADNSGEGADVLRVRNAPAQVNPACVLIRTAATGEVPTTIYSTLESACAGDAQYLSLEFTMAPGGTIGPTSGITCTPNSHTWTGGGTAHATVTFNPALAVGDDYTQCIAISGSVQLLTAYVRCGGATQALSTTFDHFYSQQVGPKLVYYSEARAGCMAPFQSGFAFDSGSAAGWTVRGAYDEYGGGAYSHHFAFNWVDNTDCPNFPGGDGTDGAVGAIALTTSTGHGVPAHGSTYWIMQLYSPALAGQDDWQTAYGYSAKLAADMASDPEVYANLFVKVYDIAQGRERTFYNGSAILLVPRVWNHLCLKWSDIAGFPTSYMVRNVWVNVWGKMSGTYNGGVYLDDVSLYPGSPRTAVGPPPQPGPAFHLYPATPNPFNPRTTVRFDVPTRGTVTLKVFDLGGRLVRTLLADAVLEAGAQQVVWDGRDAHSSAVASGVYVVQLSAAGRSGSQRIVLLK